MTEQNFFVYILHCVNDSYYTGYTTDLAQRFMSHVNGTGRCKYTKSFKPLYIAQCWRIMHDKTFAMELERAIKKLTRAEKENIISNPETLSADGRVRMMESSEIEAINNHTKMSQSADLS